MYISAYRQAIRHRRSTEAVSNRAERHHRVFDMAAGGRGGAGSGIADRRSGTRYLVPSTWYKVLGTKYLADLLPCFQLLLACQRIWLYNELSVYLPTNFPVTHSLTRSLTHSLTHPLTHSLNLSLARSPSHSLTIGGLVHWPVCTPTSHDYPYMSVPACRVLWNIALTCLSRHVRPHDTWHLHACPGVSLCWSTWHLHACPGVSLCFFYYVL